MAREPTPDTKMRVGGYDDGYRSGGEPAEYNCSPPVYSDGGGDDSRFAIWIALAFLLIILGGIYYMFLA